MSYDPSVGRWLEPLEDDVETNLYRRAKNSPTNIHPAAYGGTFYTSFNGDAGVEEEPMFPVVVADETDQEKVDKGRELFMKSTGARDLFRGTLDGRIKIVASNSVRTAGWNNNLDDPKILINPNSPDIKDNYDKMASNILFEVLNATKTTESNILDRKAKAGVISRIDYVLLHEKLEFDNFGKHHEIATASIKAGQWSSDANLSKRYFEKEGEPHEASFGEYISDLLDRFPDHLKVYQGYWNTKYATIYEQRQQEKGFAGLFREDRDYPQDTVGWRLSENTLTRLQRLLRGNDDPVLPNPLNQPLGLPRLRIEDPTRLRPTPGPTPADPR